MNSKRDSFARSNDFGRIQVVMLAVTMVSLSAGVLLATIFILYNTAVSGISSRLIDEARSLAVIFETVSRMEEGEGWPPDLVLRQTMRIIESSHNMYGGYGQTGEFLLAKREGATISYLLAHRHGISRMLNSISLEGELALPMQKALQGYSGEVRGKDYRGEEVLAAVSPVTIVGERYGLVVKVDMAELRRPFIGAAVVSAGLAAASILAALLVFHRISGGLLRRISGAERRVRDAETRLRTFLESSPDFILTLDRAGNILYVNKPVNGRDSRDMIGAPALDLLPPEYHDMARALVKDAFEERRSADKELRVTGPEGKKEWFSVRSCPVVEGGAVIAVILTVREETEMVLARDNLRRVNRTMKLLSECNQALVRAKTENELLDQICRMIAEIGEYPLVWVGIGENDSGKSVKVAAAAGSKTGYLEGIKITWDESPAGQGPTGTAIRTGKKALCNDTAADPLFAPWKETALRNGILSSSAFPLAWDNKVQGALNIYSGERGGFNAEEMGLFDELALDLSYGVKTLREREQKSRAVAALWESEARFRSLVDSAPDAIISADSRGRIISWNLGAQRLFGYPASDALGKTVSIIVPEGTREQHEKAYKRAVDTGEFRMMGVREEVNALNCDGKEFPVELTLSAWELHGERHFSAIIHDITERKKAEEKLRENEKALSNAQALAHLGNWEMDLQTGKGTWSDESYRIFGFEPGAFEPTFDSFIRLVHPEYREKIKGYMREMASGKLLNVEFDLRIIRPDGQERFINDKVEVLAGKDGKPVKLIGVNFDITEQKKAEAELRERNEDLYRALEEVKTAQSLLVRSEKLAAVGTLSAGVAHEILNPLNIIGTITQLMQMDETDAERGDRYKEIMRQVQRATKITNNLRLFARAKKADRKQVDPRPVFDHTASLMEHDLNLDNITVERDFPADLPPVFCDEDSLAQVFVNLLTNARDAMKPNRRGVIRARMRGEEGGVGMDIQDDGPGIPADIISKIFDPFFTTKEPGHGTGLGLSIVHRIMEENNGKIWVESKEGKGACFHVWLPCLPEKRSNGPAGGYDRA